MGSNVQALLEAVRGDDAIEPAGLARLQLAAANERLEEQRGTIPLLDRRATEAGIATIESPDKLLPLLFAHTAYKSYPERFLHDGQWQRMSMWLDTVTTAAPAEIDVSDVGDVDAWISRLREHGIHPIVSSGTSGKNSFLPLVQDDIDFVQDNTFLRPERSMPITFLGPSNAPMRTAYTFQALAARAREQGAAHSLEEPLLVADMMRAAAMRKRMIDETALPSDVAEFDTAVSAQATRRKAQLEALFDKVLGYADRPQLINGGWATFWQFLLHARERGVPDGSFHRESIVSVSGGRKGLDLPPDYEAQMARFLGPVRRASGYGMSELTIPAGMCSEGVYHWPRTIMLLMLDESGETLLEPDANGTVVGRLAAYDPMWVGIWGGVISGDQVTASYAPCACGQPGPTVGADIARYGQGTPGGDDKLTCAGTIDSYIRGMVGG